MAILANDSFTRTVSGGWGSADTGGTWTLVGGNAEFSVTSTVGEIALQPSYSREAYLGAISSTSSVVRLAFSSTSAYSGGAQSLNIVGRRIGSTWYQARARIESGLLRLYILRDETALASSTTISHTYTPGDKIWVEVSVTGTSPTTVAAKMWLDGSGEPGSYQQSATDSTAGYQVAGNVGLRGFLAAAAGAATLSIDDFTATDPSATVLATPAVTLNRTDPTTVGGSDGTITATWSAVPNAVSYETALASGTVTSGFTADTTGITGTSKTYTGLSAGTYTVAVRAKAS